MTYAEFLQAAQPEHIRILTLLAHKQNLATQSGTEADAIFVTLTELYQNGLISRGERAWERRDGIDWQVFEATVDPVAVAYLTQLALDRLTMSRNPL